MCIALEYAYGSFGVWLGWGGVGWGGGNNVHVNLNTHGLYGVHLGVGWGGVGVVMSMST